MVTDSPETGQELLPSLVATFRKYNMLVVPTKTIWMHVGGDELPETLTVDGESIARVKHVTYHGSVLDQTGTPQVQCARCPTHQ